jgi:hypothetical protein
MLTLPTSAEGAANEHVTGSTSAMAEGEKQPSTSRQADGSFGRPKTDSFAYDSSVFGST